MSANCFREDLDWSESQHSADWWDAYYRKAFPGLTSIQKVPGPSAAQRAGIDKFVMIAGKKISVDEKIRRERAPVDIALEFKHVPINGDPPWAGWVAMDNVFMDYLAVGFVEYKTAFFLPFLTLRHAWLKNGQEWLSKYFIAKAPNPRINPRYYSHSVCVPTEVLMGYLLDAMRIIL